MIQYKNKWTVTASYKQMCENPIVREISEKLGVTMPTAQLLVNRGCYSAEEAHSFLSKEDEQMHDPFLLRDMKNAADRIVEAIEAEEQIVIFGDYDVDGVTSVSCLYLYLKSLGGNVSYYIPSRTGEGYGMSESAIRKLVDKGCQLIITVDTGITAVNEAKVAAELNVDLIVTDHHECHSDIPEAIAVVNPHRPDCLYPFKELAGVGVVFKLLCAVESIVNPAQSMLECVRNISREYCDLVAIGTIADVMPIRDENRLIVSYGLSLIENTSRHGLVELIKATRSESKYNTKKKITASFIGYTIAPRINAAGRLSNASLAVELFISEDSESASLIAKKLCEINHERQTEENKIVEQAYARIDRYHDFKNDHVIVLDDEFWHHGVIGIVASRITEKYGCPSILISFEGTGEEKSDDDFGKGSGRSVHGMNLVETLGKCSELLEKYGGHELAAGLTIKRSNLPEFRRMINEYASSCIGDVDIQPSIEAECELEASDITFEQANELYYLEPHGVSNPAPVFLYRNAVIEDMSVVGGGKHTRLTLKIGCSSVNAMCFRQTISDMDIYPGDTVDVIFTLDINEFQNQRNLQMLVKDIRLSELQLNHENAERELFAKIRYGMKPDELGIDNISASSIIPNHDDFAAVYNVLKKELRLEHEIFSIRALINLLDRYGFKFGYVKLRFILMTFSELNILEVKELDKVREIFAFRYIYLKNKTNLDKSNIYRKLKADFGQKM